MPQEHVIEGIEAVGGTITRIEGWVPESEKSALHAHVRHRVADDAVRILHRHGNVVVFEFPTAKKKT